MGADQSTTISKNASVSVEKLRHVGSMPALALLHTLKEIELEAENVSVRKIIANNPDYIRELLGVVKKSDSGETQLHKNEADLEAELRIVALRVLITLTNGCDVSGSPEMRLLGCCRTVVGGKFDSRGSGRLHPQLSEGEDHDGEMPTTTTGLFGWAGNNAADTHTSTSSSTMTSFEKQVYEETHRSICLLVGMPSPLRYLLSKTTSMVNKEASLAALLLSNIAMGGGPKISCSLSAMLLSPLVALAQGTSNRTMLTITTATTIFRTFSVLLQHPAYEKDRVLAFDTYVKEHEFDQGSSKSSNDDEHDHSDNIPYADTYENYTHEHLLQLGLIESMLSHIGYGVTNEDLLIQIFDCVFHLCSGANLMYMYQTKDGPEAEHRVQAIRKAVMEKTVLLKYDEGYEYVFFFLLFLLLGYTLSLLHSTQMHTNSLTHHPLVVILFAILFSFLYLFSQV